MPWQQNAANILGEVNEQGRLCYNKVVITVPRQSGKTTLLLPVVVGRAEAGEAFGGRQTMLYAAQTREAAKEKWLDDYVSHVEKAKVLKGRYKKRIASGSERLTFYSTGTTFGPVPTKPESSHGKVIDLGLLDEAFAQIDNRVQAAWRPAMSTRPMAQIIMVSTMGDATALWFNDQVERARAAVLEDSGFGTCYVEFSAPPTETDFGNPEVWARCMPALGRTQTVEFIRDEFKDMPLNDFRRAYLNQQVDSATDQVLPATQWNLMRREPEDARRATRPVLIVDVAYDRSASTIALAYELKDGTPAVRIAEYGPGTSWVTDAVLRLKDELVPRRIVADSVGPVSSIVTELQAEHVKVYTTNTLEVVAACGLILDGVTDQKFVHYGEPELNKAVQNAAQRELGDAWAWTRKRSKQGSGTDISPLVAITLGYWAQTSMGEHADHDWTGGFG